jgi:hypothetical protein
MGDRCYLEITMRRADLPRFGSAVGEKPDENWWDADDPVTDHPDLVTVQLYEANYALYDQRHEAAKAGIPFYGTHGEGGEYGAYAFAALDGEMLEAPLNHEGDLILALNDDLEPVDPDDLVHLRAYVAKLRAVKALFGINAVPAAAA